MAFLLLTNLQQVEKNIMLCCASTISHFIHVQGEFSGNITMTLYRVNLPLTKIGMSLQAKVMEACWRVHESLRLG